MIDRIKSTTFWISLVSAVFLILGAFGVEIGDQTASSVVNGISSVLIMFGIIKPQNTGADVNRPPDDSDKAE